MAPTLPFTPLRAIPSLSSKYPPISRCFHGSPILLTKKKKKDPPRPPLLHPQTTSRKHLRSFDNELLLDKLVKKNLRAMKVETMTQIQSEVYGHLDDARDIVAASPIGSGKTLAYLVPWVNRKLMDNKQLKKGIHMVVLTPTSHSAKMMYNEIDQFIALMGPNITMQAVYDSYSYPRQVQRLSKKIPCILVATPSRLRKHIEESVLTKLANSKTNKKKRTIFSKWFNNLTETLVLDEFDILMEVHREDVDFVRRYMANGHQTIAMSSHSMDIDPNLVKADAARIDCRLGSEDAENPLIKEVARELLKNEGSISLQLKEKYPSLDFSVAIRKSSEVADSRARRSSSQDSPKPHVQELIDQKAPKAEELGPNDGFDEDHEGSPSAEQQPGTIKPHKSFGF